MSCIYLGNLTVKQIEKLHCFSFTDEEREYLNATQHHNASFKDGEVGWHMFDMPPFLAISKGEVGHKVLDVFMAHNSEFAFSFKAGYANAFEVLERGKA